MQMQPAKHRIGLRRRCVTLAALVVLAIVPPNGAAADDERPAAETRVGCTIRVTLPITGATTDRARRFIDRALHKYPPGENRLVLIFEFEVPPKQAEYGRGSMSGAARDLANLLTSEELQGVHTVAYVPQSIQGHAVLSVMACDEIIMAKDATIGMAGVDGDAAADVEANYESIANRRRTIPAEVAKWMLNSDRKVIVAKKMNGGDLFVSPAELAELKKTTTFESEPEICDEGADEKKPPYAKVRGQLTGSEARALGFVSALAERRADLAKALDLQPQDVEEDPAMVGELKAFQVNLTGVMNSDAAGRAENMMLKAQKEGANFICLWIDSPGGSIDASIQLANGIKKLDRQGKVRTVAYIPEQARADAALVALACTEIAMAPQAVLGGPGAREFSADDLKMAREVVADPEGPWRLRPWPLVAAMVDPGLTVYRCTRAGETAYLSQEELHDLDPLAKPWDEPPKQITVPGEQFKVDGKQAVEYRLAARTVHDFAEFTREYALEDDPAIVAPGWADNLIDLLTSDGATLIIVAIGLLAIYIELHSPGIGLGAFVALVCFALFFWLHVLGHTAGWLEITLFVVGVGCVLVEVFILPGFGVFGIGGGMLMLVSLVLASQTFVLPHNSYQFAKLERSLLSIAGACVACVATAIAIRRWLPRAPVVNQMFLEPPTGEEAEILSRRESLVELGDLLGARGTTTTQLTPSGKARFGSRLVDVICDGDVIARGTEIEVVEVQGARVIVREVGSGE